MDDKKPRAGIDIRTGDGGRPVVRIREVEELERRVKLLETSKPCPCCCGMMENVPRALGFDKVENLTYASVLYSVSNTTGIDAPGQDRYYNLFECRLCGFASYFRDEQIKGPKSPPPEKPDAPPSKDDGAPPDVKEDSG